MVKVLPVCVTPAPTMEIEGPVTVVTGPMTDVIPAVAGHTAFAAVQISDPFTSLPVAARIGAPNVK
jgi:hypothetical protein